MKSLLLLLVACFGLVQSCVVITYIGCYADAPARDLGTLQWSGINTNTVESCVTACYNAGFSYAGVQAGSQCFCGHSYGSHGTSSACNNACTGNAGETCGGSWVNSIYSTGIPPTSYMGCFTDAGTRDLQYQLYSGSSGASIEACVAGCASAGYQYAGSQDGSQCFCGDTYNNYGNVADGNCNLPCAGNSNEMCGAGWLNSIYFVGVNTYLGCWTDAGTRDLPILAYSGISDATIELCVEYCKIYGYSFAGSQDGSQCFCGNGYGSYGRSSNCNLACSGDSYQICGGAWANSVYTTNA